MVVVDTMTGMSQGFEHISVERTGDTVSIAMLNAEKRNVLSLPAMREITRALAETAETDALNVIISAHGPAFSAGHNFTDMVGADYATARELFDVCTEMMSLIQSVPQVVIAQVQGIATAAGCQLVAMCDLAVAAETAVFQTPGGKGGLFCHTPMVAVARAVGRKKGLEMALTGDPVDAQTACGWGLVNRVVPEDELEAATRELARRASRGSPFSKAQGKQTYYAQVDMPQDQAYEYAVSVMAAGVTSYDGQEGIASFMEKRRPAWKGR